MSKKTATKKTVSHPRKQAGRPHLKFNENARIKVVGEHTRRPGSRYHKGYELMRKGGSVATFFKKRDDAQELLRNATREGYIKIG